MQRLTKAERDLVLLRSHLLRKEYGLPKTSKQTHRFVVLHKTRNGGVQMLLVATRRPKDGAKVVAQWRPEDDRFFFRDMTYKGPMAGWPVQWDIEKNDAYYKETGQRPYTCSGYYQHIRWCSDEPDLVWKWNPIKDRGPWNYISVVNPEVLAETRYKYCGWSQNCTVSLEAALAAYHQNPKAESLVKSGSYYFYKLYGKTKMRDLERNHQLRRFVMKAMMENSPVMRLAWCDIKWLAASSKRTIEQARERARKRDEIASYWYGYGKRLASCIDREEAMKYCERMQIDRGRYAEAQHLAREEGLDLHARCNAFPTAFQVYYYERKTEEAKRIEAKRREDELRRKKELAERDEKIAKFIDELKEKLKRVKTGDYKILWLTKQDEFRKEGSNMHNCIGGGGYSLSMSRRECVCLVLASEGERVDVEIDSGWKVKQCYTKNNSKASDAARKIAEKIAAALKKHYTSRRKAA